MTRYRLVACSDGPLSEGDIQAAMLEGALKGAGDDKDEWVPWSVGACHDLNDEALYYTCVADRVTGEFTYLWLQPHHWSRYTRAYWKRSLPSAYQTISSAKGEV